MFFCCFAEIKKNKLNWLRYGYVVNIKKILLQLMLYICFQLRWRWSPHQVTCPSGVESTPSRRYVSMPSLCVTRVDQNRCQERFAGTSVRCWRTTSVRQNMSSQGHTLSLVRTQIWWCYQEKKHNDKNKTWYAIFITHKIYTCIFLNIFIIKISFTASCSLYQLLEHYVTGLCIHVYCVQT